MKLLLPILLAIVPLLASGQGEESYFFKSIKGPRATESRIEGNSLHLVIPIQKIDPPKASGIFAGYAGLGPGRGYFIQIDLAEPPAKDWLPMLKLGDDVLTKGMSLGRSDRPDVPSTYTIETDDPEQAHRWCRLLGKLLKLPQKLIDIDLTNPESDGAGKPAATPSEVP